MASHVGMLLERIASNKRVFLCSCDLAHRPFRITFVDPIRLVSWITMACMPNLLGLLKL